MSAGAAAQSRAISVGWSICPPYQINQDGPSPGIDSEIIQEALAIAGYGASLTLLPWPRQLKMCEQGKLDIIMGATKTDDRSVYAAWSASYRKERVALLGLASNQSHISSLKQLIGQNVRIGFIRDSEYGGEFAALAKNPDFASQLDVTTELDLNLRKLFSGRLDYLIDDPVSIQYQAIQAKGPAIRSVLEIQRFDVYFMISKKFLATDPAFLGKFNRALATLQANGRIAAIFAAYGTEP